MLKIGLFSKLSRVSIRMLRYYDEIGLLRPAFIDPDSDYRYYREDQLQTIGFITETWAFRLPTSAVWRSFRTTRRRLYRFLKSGGGSLRPRRKKLRGSCCFWTQPNTGWERKTSCNTM